MLWLFSTALPTVAADKDAGPAKDKPVVVNVGGQVNRPGPIAYQNNATILSMIVAAGGPTQAGAMKRVKITRGGKQFQVDLTQQKPKKQEFTEPGDTIEVPEKNFFGR